jgi:hypothetical protein
VSGSLWSTSRLLMMIERTGDRLNQGLLVLSNDLKSNSGPPAYLDGRPGVGNSSSQ